MSHVRKPAEANLSTPRSEEGQTMAEYALVLTVITIAIFTAVGVLSGSIVTAITRTAGYFT